MDDLPLDFTLYLSARLGLTPATTNAVLGDWLKTYEARRDDACPLPAPTPRKAQHPDTRGALLLSPP